MNTKIDGRVAFLLIVLIGGWIAWERVRPITQPSRFCAGMIGEARVNCEKN